MKDDRWWCMIKNDMEETDVWYGNLLYHTYLCEMWKKSRRRVRPWCSVCRRVPCICDNLALSTLNSHKYTPHTYTWLKKLSSYHNVVNPLPQQVRHMLPLVVVVVKRPAPAGTRNFSTRGRPLMSTPSLLYLKSSSRGRGAASASCSVMVYCFDWFAVVSTQISHK